METLSLEDTVRFVLMAYELGNISGQACAGILYSQVFQTQSHRPIEINLDEAEWVTDYMDKFFWNPERKII